MKTPLYFVHGNGFPSLCYKQLLDEMSSQFTCCYIDRIGHSADFPVTENWPYLVDELIYGIRQQNCGPVVAVGHSLGGVLSFLAAVANPGLFKAVILLDSPLFGRLKSIAIRCAKLLGVIDNITPALRTKARRTTWQDKEQALAYLKSRPLFKYFDTACLDDYITYGLSSEEMGYVLRFDRAIEYKIYRTIPHVLHNYEGQLSVPTALIYGENSTVIRAADVQYMKKKYGVIGFKTKGTHMFPLEYPKNTANIIREALTVLECS